MTYFINVNPSNLKDFLQIIKSLKNIGVIVSYGSIGDLAKEGEPISTEKLLSVLEFSRKEVEAGNIMSSEDVKKLTSNWKEK